MNLCNLNKARTYIDVSDFFVKESHHLTLFMLKLIR